MVVDCSFVRSFLLTDDAGSETNSASHRVDAYEFSFPFAFSTFVPGNFIYYTITGQQHTTHGMKAENFRPVIE